MLFIYCFKLRILLTCKNVFGTHNDIHVLIWICRVALTLQNIAAKGREILPLAPNKYLKSSWTCMSVKPVFNTRLILYWKRATKPFLLHGMGQMMFQNELIFKKPSKNSKKRVNFFFEPKDTNTCVKKYLTARYLIFFNFLFTLEILLDCLDCFLSITLII